MFQSLIKETKTKRISNAVAAGTTDVVATIDRTGFNAVKFDILFGTITSTAVTSVKIGYGDQSDGSDVTDLSDGTITVADDDDNQIGLVELLEIPEGAKYVVITVDRGTANAVIDGIVATLFNPRSIPVTQDTSSTVIDAKTVIPS